MRAAAEQFGFHEYDAPVLEPVALYERKAGEEITQQMYNFTDKEENRVTLRPEMTPSLARLVLNKTKLATGEVGEPLPLKWYSIPQCWRFETTQRGRKREHYQWNVDIAGEPSVSAELELLCVMASFFSRIGIGPDVVGIRVNSRRVLDALLQEVGVPKEDFAKVCVVIDKLDKIGPAEVTRQLGELGVAESTSAAILACLGVGSVAELADKVGKDSPAIEEMETLFRLAAAYDVGPGVGGPNLAQYLQFDASVVRGLSYYTGIVFEAFDRRGVLRAIAGGGRYDNLLSKLATEDEGSPVGWTIPMCGFGFGDCVIVELLAENNQMPPFAKAVDAVVAPYDASMVEGALTVAAGLRANGLSVDLLLQPKRAKGAFDSANKAGARLMAFVAPGEWDGGLVRVKDMLVRDASGEDGLQIDVPVKALESLPALFAAEAKKQGVSWRPLREPASGSELPGGETAGATAGGAAGETAAMAYLAEHDVAAKLNEVVNALVKEKPADAMAFIAKALQQ